MGAKLEKRYQIFVSSTFKDLEEERQEVMHALLELDCIPAGMELFPAANDDQWNLIKRVIDDCDYYILIMAGRYGSLGPDGLSYTEMEYRYALEVGKPIISFIHKNTAALSFDKSELTEEGREKLASFRALAERKLCKYYDGAKELGSVVSRSVINLIKTNPAVGWVKANQAADPDLTLELLRLRKHVDELNLALAQARHTAPKDAENLAKGQERFSVAYSFRSYVPGSYSGQPWNSSFPLAWDRIFAAVAPLMIIEASDKELRSALNGLIDVSTRDVWKSDKDFKGKKVADFYVSTESFDTIKVQLKALGLIAKSSKNRSVKDTGNYWTLTPYGDEQMTRLRAIRSQVSDTRPEHLDHELDDI